MCKSYFHFSESPFEDRLDPRFLFLGQDHREVLAALLFFEREKKGLGLVCGDVGTGKTMLLNSFLGQLPAAVHPIVIANPLIDYRELLVYLANTLGISRGEETILGLADRVKETLIAARGEGKSYLLIVDEAHLLSDANLEHIRLLSNIETPAGKLLQILLVGQYELSDRLGQPGLRQLHQRINVNRFLSPLSEEETWQYVEHRLQVAGSGFDRCFEPVCKTLIHPMTDGVPRRINHLCDTALLVCMGEGAQRVTAAHLGKARKALQTDRIFRGRYGPSEPAPSSGKLKKTLLLIAAGASLLILGGMMGSTGLWRGSSLTQAPPPVAGPEKALAALPQPAPETGPPPAKAELPPMEPPARAPAALQPQAAAAGQEKAAQPDPAPPAPPLKQVEVEENDNLTRLAGRYFPRQPEIGLVALLLANARDIEQDRIYAGQKLNLPEIDPSGRTIKVGPGLYYAFYGKYTLHQELQEAVAELTRQDVHFAVLNSGRGRNGLYRLVIGAYDTREGLEKALLRVKEEEN